MDETPVADVAKTRRNAPRAAGRSGDRGVVANRGAHGASHTPSPRDPAARGIYFELLRNLLRDPRRRLEEMARWVPVELVFKALIIREFMDRRRMQDIHAGIRAFFAYQRERLRRLGLRT